MLELTDNEPGFTRVAPRDEIRARNGKLSIPLYVGAVAGAHGLTSPHSEPAGCMAG